MANIVKKTCKYGAKCYRKNRKHLEEFDHSDDINSESESEDDAPPPKKKTKVEEVLPPPSKKKPVAKTTGTESEDDAEHTVASSSDDIASKGTKDTSGDEVDSEEEEISDVPSPTDVKENIKSKFLVDMPDDFYDFWEFAKSINNKNPQDAFKMSLGLQLVGPFDVLAGKCIKKNTKGKRPCYLRHWRYYYDPPEFQTVIRGDDQTQFHIGYFRDDPSEMPVFVASNAAKDNCTISPRGENIFAALSWFIDDKIKRDKSAKEKLKKLKEKVTEFADSKSHTLDLKTKSMKNRDKKVVTRSFHGAGMVVPVDPVTEVGYREVPETPADLKKMLKKIKDSETKEERDKHFDPLMEIIMLVQFANDECDYGEGLELGLDLFSYGGDVFHSTILNLMPLAYQLLNRQPYADITTAHLKNRLHSAKLNELE